MDDVSRKNLGNALAKHTEVQHNGEHQLTNTGTFIAPIILNSKAEIHQSPLIRVTLTRGQLNNQEFQSLDRMNQ